MKKGTAKQRNRSKNFKLAWIYVSIGVVGMLACVCGAIKMYQTGFDEIFHMGGKFTWGNYVLGMLIYVLIFFVFCSFAKVLFSGEEYLTKRFRQWKKERKNN